MVSDYPEGRTAANRGFSQAALSGPVLRPWDVGEAVEELQLILRAHGFSLRVDGVFGWITETAVKEFQQQHHLRLNGVVGPRTWAALKSTVKPGTRPLKLGDSGADVYELQGLLQVQEYSLDRTGIYDEGTQTAVCLFQRQKHLKVSGAADQITWTCLRGGPLPKPPEQPRWLLDPRRWW